MNDQWYKHLIGVEQLKLVLLFFLTAVFLYGTRFNTIYAI